jgi:hypothetical protein
MIGIACTLVSSRLFETDGVTRQAGVKETETSVAAESSALSRFVTAAVATAVLFMWSMQYRGRA